MRVRHLNCATMCPPSAWLVNGEGGFFASAKMVCHCLLVEGEDGLVLVDTGIGSLDCEHPARLGRVMVAVTRPRLAREETALAQIEALGYGRDDVRHVVLTHLDVDHAGGLPDFPRATVHVLELEHAAAMKRPTFVERERYRSNQWAHGPRWQTYRPQGEPWFGFECVRELVGLPPEILLIPLLGHSRGHAGVAVQANEGWLLHAGDAYFSHAEVHATPRRSAPALAAFQWIIGIDDRARVENQRRLRELARLHGDEVRVFSAHDPRELEAAGAAARASLDRHETLVS